MEATATVVAGAVDAVGEVTVEVLDPLTRLEKSTGIQSVQSTFVKQLELVYRHVINVSSTLDHRRLQGREGLLQCFASHSTDFSYQLAFPRTAWERPLNV